MPMWRFFWNSAHPRASGRSSARVISSALAAYAFARMQFKGLGIAVRGDDRHAAAAVPRADHPAVHHLPTTSAWSTPSSRCCCAKFLATEAFFVFLIVQFIRQMPPRHGRGGPHRRRRAPADLLVDHPAADQARPDHLRDLRVHLGLERLPRPAALPELARRTTRCRSRCASTTTNPSSDYGATVARLVLALLPVLLFFIVFQRFLVDGVATQGLKG